MRNIIFILIAFIYIPNVYTSDKPLNVFDISNNLSEPWGMTFINDKTLLITEKTGAIINVDSTTGDKYEIEHDLDFYYYGQGGLLDILYHDGYVYVSYSEDRGDGKSSTSIARGYMMIQK